MKNQKIDEVLNGALKANKSIGHRSDILDRNFSNVMFISSNPDKASEVIKSYLENEFGANGITVTPNGYEIQNEKANIQVGCVATAAIYPGDEMTDKLKKKNTVLFLPDLDQMEDKNYRRLLLDMAREHIVADSRNEDGGFALLDATFFAVATLEKGSLSGRDFFELNSTDAKNSFTCFDLDEITIDD